MIKEFRMFFLTVIVLCMSGCTGFESLDDSTSTLQSSFTCNQNTSSLRDTPSRFLSKLQLRNSVEDLFGSSLINSTAVQAAFGSLSDESNNDITFQRQSTIDSTKITAYFNIARAISEEVISSSALRATVFGTCQSDVDVTRACADSFISNYAVKILRRPLKTDEINTIYEIVDGGDTKNEKLRAMLFSLVGSPFFVWNVELGENNSSNTSFSLNSYEVASKLSYKITDSAPDASLLNAALDGSIKNESTIKAQAQRLLQTQRGKDKVIRSILRWSGANFIKDISSLPTSMVNGINTNNLENAMIDEAYKFVEHIVFEQKGSFKDLLLSKASFASHDGLADVYNHTPYVEGQNPQSFPDERMGLLLRAPFLTHYSSRSSIINRGVQFQLKILCNKIPEPNVDISADRDADSRTQEESLFHSNRSNIKEMTKIPVCMSCHNVINPTGFALESFDSLGRYRAQESIYSLEGDYERDVSVDTRTDLPITFEETVQIDNASDLVRFVAESNNGNECFVRNINRFFNEKEVESSDHCRLESAFQNLANLDAPILSVIEGIVLDENLKAKSIGASQ